MKPLIDNIYIKPQPIILRKIFKHCFTIVDIYIKPQHMIASPSIAYVLQ